MARKLTTKAITDDAITADKIVAGAVVADIGAGTVTPTHLHSSLDLSSKTVTLPTIQGDVQIEETTSSSGVNPTLTLRKIDTGNGSDNDGVAAISFKGTNSSGGAHHFGWMQAQIVTAAAGSEEGKIQLRVAGSNASYQNEAYSGGTGIEIFHDRTNIKNNLEVEDNIGIGTTSPGKKLHIKDSVPDIRLEDTDTNAVVDLKGNTGTGSFVISTDVNNAIADSKIIFEVDNDEKARIDSSGNLGIGITSPTVPIHVAPDGTHSKTTPFTLSGGIVYSNNIYTDYVYKWSGNGIRTVDLLCNSYHMAEVTYTSHQTNGGSDIHRYIKGKWANNHTTHTWTTYHDSGNTWSISLSISATDQSGSSSGSPNGRLRVRQTYNSGSYSYSTLTIRTYFDSFTGINISTS